MPYIKMSTALALLSKHYPNKNTVSVIRDLYILPEDESYKEAFYKLFGESDIESVVTTLLESVSNKISNPPNLFNIF